MLLHSQSVIHIAIYGHGSRRSSRDNNIRGLWSPMPSQGFGMLSEENFNSPRKGLGQREDKKVCSAVHLGKYSEAGNQCV